MKNLFTPEENMILTIDYYVDRLLHEKFEAEQKLQEEEEKFNVAKDIAAATKRKRNGAEYRGMIKAYQHAINILMERD